MEGSEYLEKLFFDMYDAALFIDLTCIWQRGPGSRARAQQPRGTGSSSLPHVGSARAGGTPVSPALARRFSFAVPPGKSASGNGGEAWLQRGLERDLARGECGVPLGQGQLFFCYFKRSDARIRLV